jgi:hypothetical protein
MLVLVIEVEHILESEAVLSARGGISSRVLRNVAGATHVKKYLHVPRRLAGLFVVGQPDEASAVAPSLEPAEISQRKAKWHTDEHRSTRIFG